MSDYELSISEEAQEEQSEQWTVSSVSASEVKKMSRSKSLTTKPSKSVVLSKSFTLTKSFSKFMSKATVKSYGSKMTSKSKISDASSSLPTSSDDDVRVHAQSQKQRYVTVYEFKSQNRNVK